MSRYRLYRAYSGLYHRSPQLIQALSISVSLCGGMALILGSWFKMDRCSIYIQVQDDYIGYLSTHTNTITKCSVHSKYTSPYPTRSHCRMKLEYIHYSSPSQSGIFPSGLWIDFVDTALYHENWSQYPQITETHRKTKMTTPVRHHKQLSSKSKHPLWTEM